jgi:subtilisin family serine protease
MTDGIHVPIVEAAPQDAHGLAAPVVEADVGSWRALGQVHKQHVGEGIRVGVVDTRLEEHPWFAGQVQGGPEVGDITGLLDENYEAGHATFIAGLVLQQAPAAHVVVRGALDTNGHGAIADVATAAHDLVLGTNGEPVDLLNLSLGCYGSATEEGEEFQLLLDELWQANPNLVVVAAAGNTRPDQNGLGFFPAVLADHSRLVSVAAATDGSAATLAAWSNSGPWVTFQVNGSQLVSTYLKFPTTAKNPPGRWVAWSGSSFATALASGVIAATMSPGDGTTRTATEAVEHLRGTNPLPVPLPTGPFPLTP